jgi:hypothetical protein
MAFILMFALFSASASSAEPLVVGHFAVSGEASPYDLTFTCDGTDAYTYTAEFGELMTALNPIEFKTIRVLRAATTADWAQALDIVPRYATPDADFSIEADAVPSEIASSSPMPEPYASDEYNSWRECWAVLANKSTLTNGLRISISFLTTQGNAYANELLSFLSSSSCSARFEKISILNGAAIEIPVFLNVKSIAVATDSTLGLSAFGTDDLNASLARKVTFLGNLAIVKFPALTYDYDDFYNALMVIQSNETQSGIVVRAEAGTAQNPVQKYVTLKEALPVSVSQSAVPDVKSPVAGEVPVRELSCPQYSGTVRWLPDAPLTFELNSTYTALINLTAANGYTFAGLADRFFDVDGTEAQTLAASNTGDKVALVVFFESGTKPITSFDIPGVGLPVTGKRPPITIGTSATQYNGSITWTPATEFFEANTIYTANIKLTPKNGHTLASVPENSFTVDGAESVTNPAGSGAVTAVFPVTVQAIDSLNIAGIEPPSSGVAPAKRVTETDQYTGTVTWEPDDASFKPATAYTATITIVPKNGFTVHGVPENSFKVTGASATNAADSGVVTAVFPLTRADITLAPGLLTADVMSALRQALGGREPVVAAETLPERQVMSLGEISQIGRTAFSDVLTPVGMSEGAPNVTVPLPSGSNPGGQAYVLPLKFTFTLTAEDLSTLVLSGTSSPTLTSLKNRGLEFYKLQTDGGELLQDFTSAVEKKSFEASDMTFTLSYIMVNGDGSPMSVEGIPVLFDGADNGTLNDPILLFKRELAASYGTAMDTGEGCSAWPPMVGLLVMCAWMARRK